MCEVMNNMMVRISYDAIRAAMKGKPFKMSLTGDNEITAVITAVNMGIDSHLEACNCPARGDSYVPGKKTVGKMVLCRKLDCTISPESMPVLLSSSFQNFPY